ncbi:hypothetical protein HG1285_05855 [Hydrogenivirga sp. 128-5-R1-1]|nr:hypothetical protein HG1285_05855 [Hydrogenivirga sp. 128-5-R1-1]
MVLYRVQRFLKILPALVSINL